MLIYADGTIVFVGSFSELQKALDAVHQARENWKLTVNTYKTKIVILVLSFLTSRDVSTPGPSF